MISYFQQQTTTTVYGNDIEYLKKVVQVPDF